VNAKPEGHSLDRHDVAIVGGGLAGLSLAIQIKRRRPETTIAVTERFPYPFPEAAHKVGESTTEGSGFYFANVVGMKKHLESRQYRKIGFRFFSTYGDNSDICERGEIGNFKSTTEQYPHPSYQLDRGRFENAMAEECENLGIEILDDCTVRSIDLSTAGDHRISYERRGTSTQMRAGWVIDASGRRAILKNQLRLRLPEQHDVNSGWMRVRQVLDVSTWTNDESWLARPLSEQQRFFCTTHLCGTGYWVWIIPLASRITSVGIVADPGCHAFDEISTLDRALEWLQRHEPEIRSKFTVEDVQDFLVLKHYSHRCKRVFSGDRWAITGVAGVFTDPLYSPGSELITVSNMMITDLVARSLSGEAVNERAERLDQMFRELWYELSITDFLDQYPVLGSFPLIAAKKIWNAGWYWGVMGLLIFQQRISDREFVESVWNELQQFLLLHKDVMKFLTCWREFEVAPYEGRYIDYTMLDFLRELHRNMSAELNDRELRDTIAKNIEILHAVAADYYRQCAPAAERLGITICEPRSSIGREIAEQLKTHVWSRLNSPTEEGQRLKR
jgi:flavin-dependent dehydrogenase